MEKKKINKNVVENLLLAVAIMLYFIIINFSYYRIEDKYFLIGLKILSSILLIGGIVLLEISYKKDSGKIAIHALEILFLSGHALSIHHIVALNKFQFSNYILISSYIISLYYILKAIIIAIKDKRQYLRSLSDIREIVDIKPIKKDAEKREDNSQSES